MASEPTQDNIELVLNGWLLPIRRRDLDALEQHLDPDVFWQSVRHDATCENRDAVVRHFAQQVESHTGVERLDLTGTDDHVIVGVRSRQLEAIADVELGGQIFLVFTIRDGLIARVEDHPTRSGALRAAQVAELPDWR
jgi:ketosteroid isomerase-like protein